MENTPHLYENPVVLQNNNKRLKRLFTTNTFAKTEVRWSVAL
jgi:hypothetical protein